MKFPHDCRRAICALGGCLIAVVALAQDSLAVRHFDYDRAMPLDVKQADKQTRDNVTIYDISYASPKGGRVPAYLVVPMGPGPFAAVLWGHWYWENSAFRNRKEFLEEAVVLAHSGVVSLLIDGPVARPEHMEDADPLGVQGQAELVQAVDDMRRGADLLLARKDVDPKRLAYVGHSYNATVGGFLSGLDHRFRCFVLMAGNLSDEADRKTEWFESFRKMHGAEKVDAFTAKYAWLDPGKFVSHATPAVVFLQYGSRDDLPLAQARQYAKIVSKPERMTVYDAPHALNRAARIDRVVFLCNELSLRPIPQSVVARIPDLPQPGRPVAQ